ncbi:hypothetical protein B0H17DRAFT_439190 [Mycena rosella]|uniref:Uncharacterized protein n=1 Tax=Mycena rosella TaxID=1033263 RepID=A0AAD7GMQ6_MYCRO|nr:hypothetical protein B0H17DRAFT_439190 [Mycena rosella]
MLRRLSSTQGALRPGGLHLRRIHRVYRVKHIDIAPHTTPTPRSLQSLMWQAANATAPDPDPKHAVNITHTVPKEQSANKKLHVRVINVDLIFRQIMWGVGVLVGALRSTPLPCPHLTSRSRQVRLEAVEGLARAYGRAAAGRGRCARPRRPARPRARPRAPPAGLHADMPSHGRPGAGRPSAPAERSRRHQGRVRADPRRPAGEPQHDGHARLLRRNPPQVRQLRAHC